MSTTTQTIKTYSSADSKKFTFILSFDNSEGHGALVTLLSQDGSFSVDLDKDDLNAFAGALNEATYAHPIPF